MIGRLEPSAPVQRNAYDYRPALPRHLPDALAKLRGDKALSEVLGEAFVSLLLDVKMAEHEAYRVVISASEREHLLLNV